MLIAFMLMQYFGMSANLMSLAGLAIGIGMMVDGAVVMVENSFRLLAHQARQAGESDPRDPRSGARGDEPDRVRDPDHHRGVPAAVLADRAGRQALQAHGADHHLRHGGFADPDHDAGAGAVRR